MAEVKVFKLKKDYGKIKKGEGVHITSPEQEKHFADKGLIGDEIELPKEETAPSAKAGTVTTKGSVKA